ncbi:unnamed protein product, partial [Musa hybrid cultivar]
MGRARRPRAAATWTAGGKRSRSWMWRTRYRWDDSSGEEPAAHGRRKTRKRRERKRAKRGR